MLLDYLKEKLNRLNCLLIVIKPISLNLFFQGSLLREVSYMSDKKPQKSTFSYEPSR